MTEEELVDITVIGGGPAGIFTAFYAGMRQASVKIIESLPQLGGQLSALYPEKYIYDVAGFPQVAAQSLVDNLKQQLELFKDNTTVCLEQAVQTVKKEDGYFTITTNKGVHYTKSIIITAGNGAFQPRKLQVEGCERYEAHNLHYFVTDLEQFSDRNVVIFGGGDSAVDWALMLEPIARKVTLVHRRDKFRAHEHSVELLHKSNVEILTPFVPEQLCGEQEIEQVVLKSVQGEQEKTLPVDDVIVTYGFVSSLGPIKEWELEIERNSIVVNSRMETNVPGIYAAGDISTYDGKVKLIVTGFGEAATAVSNAKTYIDPTAKVQSVHSTSLMEKKVLIK